MAVITPQQLAQTRVAAAAAVLRNEVDFRGYPHRHVAITAVPSLTTSGATPLLEAVEYLSHYGWELVSVTTPGNSRMLYAFLRRS